MSKLLLLPPDGTTGFTFAHGCGKPHECDGKPIDCEKCVEHVATLPPDERVAMHLRGPAPVRGANPEEIAAYAAAYTRDRDRYSWRLIPAGQDPDTESDNPLADELERLKAENAELRKAATRKSTAKG